MLILKLLRDLVMYREKRNKIFKRSFWMCEYPGCNRRATEIAHRIANTEENNKLIKRILQEKYNIDLSLSKEKKRMIKNPLNLAAHSRQHDDYFNCGYNMDDVYTIIDQCKKDVWIWTQ